MKLLVDVGVSNEVEKYLKEVGFDTKCIREINPRLKDNEIIDIAAKDERVIITMDKDFGELVFKSGKVHAGILLLRLENFNFHQKVQIVKTIMDNYSNKLENNFCVFHNGKLRVRKLAQ